MGTPVNKRVGDDSTKRMAIEYKKTQVTIEMR